MSKNWVLPGLKVLEADRGHKSGCNTLEAEKRPKKRPKKVEKNIMDLLGFEPGTICMVGVNPNHYTTVLYIEKGSKVIFMFFPNACH